MRALLLAALAAAARAQEGCRIRDDETDAFSLAGAEVLWNNLGGHTSEPGLYGPATPASPQVITFANVSTVHPDVYLEVSDEIKSPHASKISLPHITRSAARVWRVL